MSDSGSVGSQFVGEMKSTVAEVAKDVKDTVGEMIEQGVQSVASPQLTPQQIQQKQQDDANQIAEARRKIAFYKMTDEEQKSVIQENRQKEAERIQAQQQEIQAKQAQKAQMQQQTAKKPGAQIPEEVARARQEIGKGHGIGG